MNVTELLNGSDIAPLRAMADLYACECNRHSKLDLIKHIQPKLSSIRIMTEHVDSLSSAKRRFLYGLLFEEQSEFAQDELVVRKQYSTFADEPDQAVPVQEWVGDFLNRGWLFQGQRANSRHSYRIAQDWRMRMQRVLTERLGRPGHGGITPVAVREEIRWLLDDLTLLLRFVGEAGLDLTQSGTVQKKLLQQYMNQCTSPESLQLQGLRFGYGRSFRVYPDRFSLLFDFAMSQGWLCELERKLHLTSTGVQASEQLSADELQVLFRFWLKSYRRAIPNLAALVRLIVSLCGEWLEEHWLVERLKPFVRPFYYDDARQILALRVLPMMVSFGLLRMGHEEAADENGFVRTVRYFQATSACSALLGPAYTWNKTLAAAVVKSR